MLDVDMYSIPVLKMIDLFILIAASLCLECLSAHLRLIFSLILILCHLGGLRTCIHAFHIKCLILLYCIDLIFWVSIVHSNEILLIFF